MSANTPTLARKLAEVMAAVERIPKHGRNEFHHYDYATEADIVAAIRGELAKRHVMLLPAVTRFHRESVGEKGQMLTHLEMEFTFIDGDSGDTLSRPWLGAGTDKEDKGAYKAMTGGEKYFLLKTFLIPTGDDPEAEGEPKKVAPSAKPAAPARPIPAAARPQAATQTSPATAASVRVTGAKVGKTGRNARGPWTLHVITLSDRRELTTFDAAVYDKAVAAKADGREVDPIVAPDGKTLTDLRPVFRADRPAPATDTFVMDNEIH